AEDADWNQALNVIVNAKTDKISGCNALDKVLLNPKMPDYENRLKELRDVLQKLNVEIVVDEKTKKILPNEKTMESDAVWDEEFLALKIVVGAIENLDEAIEKINAHSGKH